MTFLSLPIVLDAVAKASVILAVTALVAAVLRQASASARHFIWTLGLLSALAAPVLSVALPRWELPIVRVRAVEATMPTEAAGTRKEVAQASGAMRHAPPLTREHSTEAVAGTSQITIPGGASIPWRAILIF